MNKRIKSTLKDLVIALFLLTGLAFIPVHAQQDDTVTAGSSTVQGTFSGAKPTEYPDWFKESFLEFSDDIAEAAEQGKRVMLLFHQDGCPYCNLLVERNLSQKNILEKVKSKFDVIAINIWGDREVVTVGGKSYSEKDFSAALKVQFTPTLLFFNEKGKAILKLNGYLPPQDFLTAIDFVADRHESKVSYREFVRAAHTDSSPSMEQLISQPFFQPPPYDLQRKSEARPLAVFFEQSQCPNCETLHNKVLVDPNVRQYVEKFDAVQLDMWSNDQLTDINGVDTTARDWADSLDVSFAPTIVLFDRSGKEIIRSEAWFKRFHTLSLFDYVDTEAYRDEPNFQRYISNRAEHLIEKGIDVDIWN